MTWEKIAIETSLNGLRGKFIFICKKALKIGNNSKLKFF